MVTPLVRSGWLLLGAWFSIIVWMCFRLREESLSISPSSLLSNMLESYGMFYGWSSWLLAMGLLGALLSIGAGDLLIRWIRSGKARDR